MMWHGYGLGSGLGWLWLILALAGLALLVYVAIRLSTKPPSTPPPAVPPQVTAPAPGGASDSARRILEERYARGEIDTEEFTERRRALDDR